MADYRLTVKVRNANLLRAMEAKGMPTAADLHRASGVCQTTIGQYLNLALSPVQSNGDYRISAIRICEALNKMPVELWSEQQLTPLDQNKSEKEITAEQVFSIRQLERYEETTEAITADELLAQLRPREREIISRRIGYDGEPEEQSQIGESFDVSRARIHQIEKEAIRRMRRYIARQEIDALSNSPEAKCNSTC